MSSTVGIVAKKQQLKTTHTVTTESELQKYDIKILCPNHVCPNTELQYTTNACV